MEEYVTFQLCSCLTRASIKSSIKKIMQNIYIFN